MATVSSPAASNRSRPVAAIVLAFAVLYIVWGTTYLGITYSLQSLPPFLSGAIRFLAAGTLIGLWVLTRSPQSFREVPLITASLAGVLLSGIGNGLVVFAQQAVPSGVAALVVSAIPGFVLLFDALFFARVRPAFIRIVGVLVAIGGVGLLTSDMGRLSGTAAPLHVISLLAAAIGWSFGTLIQQRAVTTRILIAFTAVQMLAGGLFQLLASALHGEWQTFDPAAVTTTSWLAVGYLIILGSILAFNCYLWLLTQVSATAVTTYALVNPVIALILGAVMLDERITSTAGIAAVMVLGGVALVLFHGAFATLERRRKSGRAH
jgi:drug/metabolite transporter (DMT)-like permease